MSTSYKAILYWGFEFESSEMNVSERVFQGPEEFSNQAAERLLGSPLPYVAEERASWFLLKQRAFQEWGCEVSFYHIDPFSFWGHFVTVTGFHWRAEGDGVHLKQLPVPGEKQQAKLQAFCFKLGIPWQDPLWHLVPHVL